MPLSRRPRRDKRDSQDRVDPRFRRLFRRPDRKFNQTAKERVKNKGIEPRFQSLGPGNLPTRENLRKVRQDARFGTLFSGGGILEPQLRETRILSSKKSRGFSAGMGFSLQPRGQNFLLDLLRFQGMATRDGHPIGTGPGGRDPKKAQNVTVDIRGLYKGEREGRPGRFTLDKKVKLGRFGAEDTFRELTTISRKRQRTFRLR